MMAARGASASASRSSSRGGGRQRTRRHHRQQGDKSRRSRSRRRRDRHRKEKDDGAAPPQDWRGPALLDPRGPPPQDWRGPNDWRGPPGPPGSYPPPRPGVDPRWPMPFAPPMPGQFPQRGPMPPGGPHGWHMPPMPHPEGPPDGWRGVPQRPPYRPGEPPSDMWAARPPSAPSGAGQWCGVPQIQQQPPPRFGPREPEKPLDSTSAAGAASGSESRGAGGGKSAAAAGASAASIAAGDMSIRGFVEDGDDEEDTQPKPQTASDRLRGVRIVRSALSELTLTRLRNAGIPVDGQKSSASIVGRSGAIADEAGTSEELPVATASAHSRCSRLGLDGGSAQRARLPPPMPGPPRLPACTIGLNHVGLWERFRKICGTPVPPDTPPIPCELRTSRGGGHVVVPLVIAIG